MHNDHIRRELSQKVAGVFDVAPYLGVADAPHMAKYGGHPDPEGCAVWAEALSDYLTDLDIL